MILADDQSLKGMEITWNSGWEQRQDELDVGDRCNESEQRRMKEVKFHQASEPVASGCNAPRTIIVSAYATNSCLLEMASAS